MRYARNVRSFALCGGLHEPYVRLKMLKAVGILPEEATCVPPRVEQRLDLAIGGVNHFTWVTRFVYDSQDMLPKYRARQAEAADAFLELRCDVDMSGPRLQPRGEMPRGVLGLTQQVLDTHELTAEAGATFNRDLVLRALATDPIVNNLVDAKKIMDETFDRQRDVLDKRWY